MNDPESGMTISYEDLMKGKEEYIKNNGYYGARLKNGTFITFSKNYKLVHMVYPFAAEFPKEIIWNNKSAFHVTHDYGFRNTFSREEYDIEEFYLYEWKFSYAIRKYDEAEIKKNKEWLEERELQRKHNSKWRRFLCFILRKIVGENEA